MTERLRKDEHHDVAVEFVGTLWAAIRSTGGLRQEVAYRHFPDLFNAQWIGGLHLPIGENKPEGQTVTLGGGNLHFDRPVGDEATEEAYKAQPRTRIYESIDALSGGWPATATRYMSRLTHCAVTCTLYESSANDETLGSHRDGWFGAVVQMIGQKTWWLGEDAVKKRDEQCAMPTVMTKPGDVLLLNRGLLHDVQTPRYSVHMGMAIIADEPTG